MVVVNRMRMGQTLVPNIFIDKYLSGANGEYVKVYIMLLRQMDGGSLTVETLADALEITEKDVLRALGYWEKQGLISAEYKDGALTRLVIMDMPDDKSEAIIKPEKETVPSADTDETAANVLRAGSEASVSQERLSQLTGGDPEFKQLVYVSEQFLARNLSKADLDFLAWVYDGLHFSLQLSEYLVEYCVGLNKKSVSYMKAVALGWQKAGVKDLDDAKKQVAEFNAPAKHSGKSSKNKFLNFEQRDDDLDAFVYGEMKKNGTK